MDLTIEPAHLEEAFLELYEDAEPNGGDEGSGAPGPTRAEGADPAGLSGIAR